MNLKTFIKWSGNKSKQLKHLLPNVPSQYNTYIEPFVGSGALFLKLQPSKWIINDLNKDLVNCWNSIKNTPNEIITIFNVFGNIFKNMENKNKIELCKHLTTELNSMQYDSKRASVYMLMKFCVYNGNILLKNRFYFGGLDMNIYIRNQYYFLEEKMQTNIININNFVNTTAGRIYNTDYKKILLKAKSGDFVFLDPPYIEDHNYNFNYNKNEILDIDFIKDLYLQACRLDDIGAYWMMTQADTPEIHILFNEFKIIKYTVYRAGLKEYVNELLIMNYV